MKHKTTLLTTLVALVWLAAPRVADARDYRMDPQKPQDDGTETIRIDINGEHPGAVDVRVRIDEPPYERDEYGEEKKPGKDPGAEQGGLMDYDKKYRLDNAIAKAAAIVECINAQLGDKVTATQGKDENDQPTAEVFITGIEGETVVLGVDWDSGTSEYEDVIEVAHISPEPEPEPEPEPDPFDDPWFWFWLMLSEGGFPFLPLDPVDFYALGSANTVNIEGSFTGYTADGEPAILNVGSNAMPTLAFSDTEDAVAWIQSAMFALGHKTIRGPGNTLLFFTMGEGVPFGTNDVGVLGSVGSRSPEGEPPAWLFEGAMEGTLIQYDGM